MEINIKKQFPVFTSHPELVFLDSASTTQKPQPVIDAITGHYSKSNSNVHRGLYDLARNADLAWLKSHEVVAEFINAKSYREVFFTRNTTEGLNIIANALRLEKGDVVVLSQSEHHSNLLPWLKLQDEAGIKVVYIRINEEGNLDYDSFLEILKSYGRNIKVLSLTHMSNVLGIINPIEKFITLAKQTGIITVVDAAQSVAHTQIDVQGIGCDFLVFSSHKIYGPSGVGVVYGKESLLLDLDPVLRGGEMVKMVMQERVEWNDLPWKFEAGTPAIEAGVGLSASLQWLTDYIDSLGGWDRYAEKEVDLTKYASDSISKIEGIDIVGRGLKHGVISFNLKGIHPHDVAGILSENGICVRAGFHCAQPFHQLLGLSGSVRMSLGVYNDRNDVDRFVAALESVNKLFN